MNILTDTLPDYITVGRVNYPILTDFRIWIEFERTMNLIDTETKDKIMMVLKLCLDGERCRIMPEDIKAAIKELSSFYLCGKAQKNGGAVAGDSERAFDFSSDSGYIYSAFLTQYGIDLLAAPYMHWHVFCALLEGLEETRRIKKIISFRLCRPEDAENHEKRKYLKKMKEIYALADIRSDKEKDEEVAEILSKIF